MISFSTPNLAYIQPRQLSGIKNKAIQTITKQMDNIQHVHFSKIQQKYTPMFNTFHCKQK